MRDGASLIACGLLAAVAAAVPATAQVSNTGPSAVNPPSRAMVESNYGSHPVHNYDEFQTELNMRRLADPVWAHEVSRAADRIASCIVKRGGDLAPSYLGGGLAGDANYERLAEVLNGKLQRCVEMANAQATATAISGSLAAQLLKAGAPAFSDRAQSVNEDDARMFYGELGGTVSFDTIAGCLAVYSPGLTYKVIQTDAGSAGETSALTALYDETPECGLSSPPSSVLPPIYQRAALATALYQWNARS